MADVCRAGPVPRHFVRSAQRLAQRHKWRRRPGNDGTARVEVPAGADQPTDRPQGDDRGDVAYVVAALKEAHAATVAAKDGEISALRDHLQAAQTEAREARIEVEQFRQAETARKGQGRCSRLKAAWRGE